MVGHPKKVKQEKRCNFSETATFVYNFFQYRWKYIKTDVLNLYDLYDWKGLKWESGFVSDSFG